MAPQAFPMKRTMDAWKGFICKGQPFGQHPPEEATAQITHLDKSCHPPKEDSIDTLENQSLLKQF